MSQIKVDTITDELGTGAPNFPYGAEGIGGGFTYAAVSGATQDLDLDSGNFFNAGGVTTAITLTFSNVPTEARWQYSFKPQLSSTNAWDVSEGIINSSFSVAAQATNPENVFFKPDGSRMYVLNSASDDVSEYLLSNVWSVASASFNTKFDISSQEATAQGMFFKPDGTKMYIMGYSSDALLEYNLSTAWDLSTASYSGNSFNVSAQDSYPLDIFFKADGTKLYILGLVGQEVNEYSLSTAWDISTITYVRTLSVSSQDSDPQGIFFKPDGTKMYIIGTVSDDVLEYNLSTAWDISTASYSQGLDISLLDGTPQGVFFKDDGTRMYIVGSQNDTVHELHFTQLPSVTFPASVENPFTSKLKADARVTYDLFTADGGTTVTLIGETIV